jgi:hypothetical protein
VVRNPGFIREFKGSNIVPEIETLGRFPYSLQANAMRIL